jgi:hypothetical protein
MEYGVWSKEFGGEVALLLLGTLMLLGWWWLPGEAGGDQLAGVDFG